MFVHLTHESTSDTVRKTKLDFYRSHLLLWSWIFLMLSGSDEDQ